ncbi:MAG: hypothetical protein KAX31_03305, partial [Thermoplasmata archaeon]|nr:hypothetical protein [Thermoplasmata archaeon]
MDIEEYIKLSISMSNDLMELLEDHLETIADSTRANEMAIVEKVEEEDYEVEWNIEEENVVIGITELHIKKAIDEFLCVPGIKRDLALALVEAGITDNSIFMSAQREFLLKIQGMSHSKLRKIKEYYETAEELRELGEEPRCPLCDGIVDPGANSCQRCGKDLVEDDVDLDIELIGFTEDDDVSEELIEELVKEEVVKVEAKAPEEEVEISEEIMEEIPVEEKLPEETSETLTGKELTDMILAEEKAVSVSTTEEPVEELAEPAEKPTEAEPLKEDVEAADMGKIITGGRDKIIFMLAENLDVKPSLAKLLYEGGYDTLEKFEGITEEELRAVKGIGKITARKIIESISTEETQMCSLCNAIVPVDVKACPRCGVRFIPGDDSLTQEERLSALKKLEKKLKSKPDSIDLLYAKTMTLKEAGRLDEALDTLNEALKMAPEDEQLIEAKELFEEELAKEEVPEPTKKDLAEAEVPIRIVHEGEDYREPEEEE